MINTVKCNRCGTEIEITRAILEEARAEIEPLLKKQAEANAQEKFELEKKEYQIKLKQQEERLFELRDREIKLLDTKTRLENEKKELDLHLARKLEEKTRTIYESVFKKAQEEFSRREQELKFKESEKNKIIESLKKDLSEAQRKTQISSQQLQGEILEIEVEEMLKKLFPHDIIEEIEKGVSGSDIRHIIKSPLGAVCGIILWECKRTKNWSSSWISKLKADLRSEKADIPVIITTILPKDFENQVGISDGVYICEFAYAAFLARILRDRITAVARQKAISANRESKSERLYNYITSNVFRQHLKFMFETYKHMRDEIEKERKIFEKHWKEREIQIDNALRSATGVYATIAAELGSSMPQLEDFELKALSSGEE